MLHEAAVAATIILAVAAAADQLQEHLLLPPPPEFDIPPPPPLIPFLCQQPPTLSQPTRKTTPEPEVGKARPERGGEGAAEDDLECRQLLLAFLEDSPRFDAMETEGQITMVSGISQMEMREKTSDFSLSPDGVIR